MISLDFETKSYADLKKVGAWAYSEDPSTAIICLCYGIDSQPIQEWWPGKHEHDRMPEDLYVALMTGHTVEAFNVSFEYSIWANIMVKRYGWVPVLDHQWRDTMATASYYALPSSLDKLAQALGYGGKDPEGARLITKYSKLHLKTAKSIIPPEDFKKFVAYCRRDVELEQAISDELGDLPERELPIYQLDLRINARGLGLDLDGIAAATEIMEKRAEELTEEFKALTGGITPTKLKQLHTWFAEQGLVLENMQAEYLEELLEGDGDHVIPQGPARRALEIRLQINKASTKKLDKMAQQCGSDGRARFQTKYHGAGTGRNTGSGFQPLNLVRSWEKMDPEQLVRDIMYRDPRWLDCLYGSAPEAISKASRYWIKPDKGKVIMAADFVSIEAVGLACASGEDWKVDAFRRGVKIYEAMADKIYGFPPGTVTKETHPLERHDGKTCLGASTQVLTDDGWKDIADVSLNDKVWDGIEWVSHGGVISQGVKPVFEMMGVEITPDHKVLVREGVWVEAAFAAPYLNQILEIGTDLSPFAGSSAALSGESSGSGSRAIAESESTSSQSLKPVYDVVNAGPRKRFMIRTLAGPVIVHNCELAFGYQGALNAWLKFDSSGRHTDERIIEMCKAWRREHPAVVATWRGVENAAIECVRTGKETSYRDFGFAMVDEWLAMILPDGKHIWYRDPQLRVGMPRWHDPEVNEDCAEGTCKCKPQPKLTYMSSKNGNWFRNSTYGGKLTENAIQATSRQLIWPAALAVEAAGYPVILTVYDEIVAEVPEGFGSLKEFEQIILEAMPAFAKDWPIRVDGWAGTRYKK